MDLAARFRELQDTLQERRAFWQPAPFHVARPQWCDLHPQLDASLRRLDTAMIDRLADDPRAARDWLASSMPELAALNSLCELPPLAARALPASGAHFDWAIPGRKREQIEAFAAHLPAASAPLLEWCAGKGHLGRRLALLDRVSVHSLEIDPRLCREIAPLAERAGVDQTALCADALDENAASLVRGRQVVALHACGELHRALVRGASSGGAFAYHIAPCCYQHGVVDRYRALSRDARLALDRSTLRLAVTETVTAPPHQRRRVAREQSWKLGFIALRDAIEGPASRNFLPVPASWLSGGFENFCHLLARREGVRLPAHVDWACWLARGEQRRTEVRRLEIVRHAYRRPLEVWLVLDLALGFQQAGFDVQVGIFCERRLTPRNVMVRAVRGAGGAH